MPRSTPAADAATPEHVPPADVEAVEPVEATTPPEWGNWRYLGPAGRIYTNGPWTPEPGDIVFCLGCPATDGMWEPTTDPVTRMPDNWRPEPTDEETARLRGDAGKESTNG